MFNKLLLLITCTLIISSCAGVNVTRITKENQDEEGIRFYRPYPYLLLIEKPDSIEYRIIWLPKTDDEYAFQVRSGFGSTEYSITLENGWKLTAFNEKRDSKIEDVVKSGLGNLTDILKMQTEVSKSEREKPRVTTRLFAFTFSNTGDTKGMVTGLREIRIPVIEQEEN